MLHSGLEEDAAALARKDDRRFRSRQRRHHRHQRRRLRIDDEGIWAPVARRSRAGPSGAAAFSAKCRDISEILCELEPLSARHPLTMRAAYHDACHLQHAQGMREQPRRLLAGIPQLEIAEIPEASFCCGSAGIFNLLQPQTAASSAAAKSTTCSTRAQAVISANPGCLLQLMHGLRSRGLEAMPAFHMVESLDASIRGISGQELLAASNSRTIMMARYSTVSREDL